MFDWLVNFGNWLSDIFHSVLSFLESIIHGIVNIFKMIPPILSLSRNAVAYLPSIFAVFITITVIIYVVYLIVGRDAGGN